MADPLTYPPEIVIESTEEAWNLVLERYPCNDDMNPELLFELFEIGAFAIELILEVLSHL